ncbi:hypothetical protein HRbin36_02404 [bacterium HR36]|nr:hypothetical protein HRbin36_02404 [bacterium HR36]
MLVGAIGRTAQQFLEFLTAQLFFLEQRFGNAVEFFAVVTQEFVGTFVRFPQQTAYFLVNQLSGAFAEVAWFLNFLAEKHMLLANAISDWAKALAHSPMGYHEPGDACRLFQVHFRAGIRLAINQAVSGATPHEDGEPGLKIGFVVVEAFLFGDIEVDAESLAARNDAHFERFIGVGHEPGDQSVSCFVVGGFAFVFGGENFLAFSTDQDFIECPLEIVAVNLAFALPRGQKGSFIDQVTKIGSRRSDQCAGDLFEIDIGSQGLVAGVYLEDFEPASPIGTVNSDMAVEAAWTQQGGIEHVGAVGGRDDDHRFRR